MNESVKSRVRLWLRSERAMGLSSLPLRLVAAPIELAAPAAVPARAVVAPARPVAVAPAPVVVPRQAMPKLIAAPRDSPLTSPPQPREQRIRILRELDEMQVKPCILCRLCEQRAQTVFGEGDPEAKLLFIGEGPGETEDQTGRPFVGRAGQKLDGMIGAMGLKREQVYICNIVKCRPPENRAPAPDEIEACTPYLIKQLEMIRPHVIVTLGLPATRYITGLNLSMGRLRGQWHSYRGIKVMPTYHPSYVLRNYTVETRKAVWSDLQQVMAELGLQAKKSGVGGNTDM